MLFSRSSEFKVRSAYYNENNYINNKNGYRNQLQNQFDLPHFHMLL